MKVQILHYRLSGHLIYKRRCPIRRLHCINSSTPSTRQISSSTSPFKRNSVMTIFRWPGALNSKQVSVTGTFSDWNPVELIQTTPGGDFYRSFQVPIGEHEYKFLADTKWKIYPSDPVTMTPQGNCNNHLFAYPTVRFVWDEIYGGKTVYITGSFNQWKELLPLNYDSVSGDHSLDCYLPPGRYDYIFLVDGEWRVLGSEKVEVDSEGRRCNQVLVKSYAAYRLYYATGWQNAIVQVRLRNAADETTPWKQLTLCDTRSRAQYFGVSWRVALVVKDTLLGHPPSAWEDSALEFCVVNEDGKEDRPRGREYYSCPVIGGYKLQDGVLKPFSKAVEGPVMLVSDLDGTMVNHEGKDPDAEMKEFTSYWENNASLCNSILIFNTGRSLGQFTYLLSEKAGALSLPDAVITAVGTKIFHLSTAGRGRSRASGLDWVEDVTWSGMLDESWDLALVREGGEKAVRKLQEAKVRWLDYGEEHPHRIAFCVRVDALEEIQHLLQAHCARHHLQIQVIVSGTGGWRYLDCVPQNGGKLKALEYVRKYYNIPIDRCVAAGDSCNDISMLEGKNPAIIVGNAQEDLRKWLLAQPQTNRVVYSDACHAKGILEGLGRLGLY